MHSIQLPKSIQKMDGNSKEKKKMHRDNKNYGHK